ncbi:MAG: BamA/TamA family outer membrane protein [Deltaproteobacteria bacterium]|nr:BamA/TamA family outer membrane protein [Deltaproteobacteria bacterium]
MCRLLIVIVCATSIAHAQRLSEADLARKNEGGYVTGLPLVAYSTDIGFGGGARAYYYFNGKRTDPRFRTTPYLHRVFLQGFLSTRGVQFHWLDYDAPRIAGTRYRIRSQLIYGRNINQNYFGLGSRALDPLRFPGSPDTFDSYADYYAAQQRIDGGQTYTKYDQLDLAKPLWIASIERSFGGDRVRVLGGLGFSYATIRDYTGKQVDAIDDAGNAVDATQAPTRLRVDCDGGDLVGCSGGFDNFFRLGISYDTRDYEPDPNCGTFIDVALDAGSVALGSEYDYLRLLAAARGYYSPIPQHADLVLAGRGLIQFQSSGVPFFSMNGLPFTEDFRSGLGGHRTLRGYRQDRFVGRTMAALNAEVRWTFTRFKLWRQKFGLIAVPFFDLGRSFDHAGALTLDDWRPSYGGALRISWNLATIVTIDYGRSSEDTGLYINFGHIF